MFGLGTREIVILAAILVLLFGPKKIPELAKNLAEAIRHIRKGFSDETETSEAKAESKDAAAE
jgi:sec-independent protein translocase protein TatA